MESGNISNIYQRLAQVRAEVTSVEKAGRHTHFKFAKHDDVTAALAPVYLKHGVDREVTVIDARREGPVLSMRVQVCWVNIDDPKDRKTIEVFAEGVDSGTRRDGSLNIDGLASGKALSYAVKLAELKNLCLVADVPDNEQAIGATAPDVAAPTTEEYKQLVELYKSCETQEELTKLRGMMMPLVQQKKLTPAQVAELSKLDHEAKQRSAN